MSMDADLSRLGLVIPSLFLFKDPINGPNDVDIAELTMGLNPGFQGDLLHHFWSWVSGAPIWV